MHNDPIEAQSLRLLKAFFGIEDEETRDLIVKLAEAAMRGAKITGQIIEPPVPT